MALEQGKWYGLQVVPNREYIAEADLKNRGYEVFLPSICSVRRWSDRTKVLKKPMFPGYIFCRYDVAVRSRMIESSAVVRLVGFGGLVVPIDGEEILSIRLLSDTRYSVQPHRGLVTGQRVVVLSGPLTGLYGIFAGGESEGNWLFVQVTLFQRSVRLRVEPGSVAAVNSHVA